MGYVLLDVLNKILCARPKIFRCASFCEPPCGVMGKEEIGKQKLPLSEDEEEER